MKSTLLFLRVDESPVQTVIRNEIYAEKIELIEQRYPATGTNNVHIQLAVTDIKGKKNSFCRFRRQQRYLYSTREMAE